MKRTVRKLITGVTQRRILKRIARILKKHPKESDKLLTQQIANTANSRHTHIVA